MLSTSSLQLLINYKHFGIDAFAGSNFLNKFVWHLTQLLMFKKISKQKRNFNGKDTILGKSLDRYPICPSWKRSFYVPHCHVALNVVISLKVGNVIDVVEFCKLRI